MIKSNKLSLSLSILMLLLHPVAHAEFYGKPEEESSQIQQLQTQLKEANGRIAALETAKNTTDQDISAIKNSTKSEASNTNVRRSANGHGR